MTAPGAARPAPARPTLRERLGTLLHTPLGLRLSTAAVGLPAILGLIWAGGWWFAAATAIVLFAAVHELTEALGVPRRDPARWLAAAGAAAMALVAASDDVPTVWPFTTAVAALLVAPVLADAWAQRRHETPPPLADLQRQAVAAAFALLYLGWLGSYFVLLREAPQGRDWILLAVLTVMTTDTGAFAVGRLLGQHRLAPRISPKKTVEGAVGGMLAGYVAVTVLNRLTSLDIAYGTIAILAVALPALAQAGDLAESVIKRGLGIKDFSRLLPGHGGLSDRLDSLLFGVPTVYFFLQWAVL